jgi:hypothetical protein
MPACEGRPDGPCPDRRNDTSVHFTQGDLFLCDACEMFRFPTKDRRTGSAGNRKTADPRGPRNNPVDGAVCSENPDVVAASAMDATRSPDLILDELLSYVGFYRISQTRTTCDALFCPFIRLMILVRLSV